MTETFQIPKDPARVRLHPPGLEAEVYLSRDARMHGGHETISDLVGDPDPFLPTRTADGETVLFRKRNLDWILIHDPLETEESFFEASGYAHRKEVRLSFEDGSELDGAIVFVSPEGSSRVSDLVNHQRGFLHFEDDHHHYLVNLDRICRIRLPPAE